MLFKNIICENEVSFFLLSILKNKDIFSVSKACSNEAIIDTDLFLYKIPYYLRSDTYILKDRLTAFSSVIINERTSKMK